MNVGIRMFLVVLQKALREVFMNRLCSSLHLLSSCVRREADVLKGNCGIFNRGIKNLSGPVGSVFGFIIFGFAFKFPWYVAIAG